MCPALNTNISIIYIIHVGLYSKVTSGQGWYQGRPQDFIQAGAQFCKNETFSGIRNLNLKKEGNKIQEKSFKTGILKKLFPFQNFCSQFLKFCFFICSFCKRRSLDIRSNNFPWEWGKGAGVEVAPAPPPVAAPEGSVRGSLSLYIFFLLQLFKAR